MHTADLLGHYFVSVTLGKVWDLRPQINCRRMQAAWERTGTLIRRGQSSRAACLACAQRLAQASRGAATTGEGRGRTQVAFSITLQPYSPVQRMTFPDTMLSHEQVIAHGQAASTAESPTVATRQQADAVDQAHGSSERTPPAATEPPSLAGAQADRGATVMYLRELRIKCAPPPCLPVDGLACGGSS